MSEIIPIKKIIKNKKLVSLLVSQFPDATELGLGYIGTRRPSDLVIERYQVYAKTKRKRFSKDRFFIDKTIRDGEVKSYSLEGTLYF